MAQSWPCYGGNAQHSGVFTGTSQPASLIKWQAPLDDQPPYYGGSVLIHYAAPMVSPSNSVVYGYRYTTTVNGQSDYDHWSMIAKAGATGQTLWRLDTDYSGALVFPADWTTVFPITLFQSGSGSSARGVVAAGSGGSLIVRASADAATSTTSQFAFYTTPADFAKNKASYAPIKINTPLTADSTGNIYFGYEVIATLPSNLSSLGTGGIAKVNANTGVSTFKSVQSMGIDSTLSRPAMNAAPALTTDGNYIYVALTGNNPWLAKLSTKDLTSSKSVQIIDPSIPGANAYLINESSASPMIGPDGHVFMGVFGNQWRESHGWMVQYDGDLNANDASGKRFPTGAFGWDDTAVVVPSNIVPAYKGTAKYLILTKYNNYDDAGGDPGADGSNHIAVLDPTSDSVTKDRQTGIPVMNEVIKVLGPTRTYDDTNHPDARNEWCINSAAIDVNGKSAIINSEDGHMYRWNFVSNSLTENLALQPPTGEAYTETSIGPDGALYVINNSILFAIGTNNASSISVVQGSKPVGTLKDVWAVDGKTYSTQSVKTPDGQSATIEADFALATNNPTTLNIVMNASATLGVTGFISAFNYTTGGFDYITTPPMNGTITNITTSITSNVSQYIGPGGKIRIRLQGVLPAFYSTKKFALTLDMITCGAG